MEELAPGLLHWTARHPKIRQRVSSYWIRDPGILIDPLAVPDEVDHVREIVLSNRHHLRDSLATRERFGADIRAPKVGMHEFAESDPIEPYDFGDSLAGGSVTVHEVGAICPDEAAIHIPSVAALSLADGVIRPGDQLMFVPDSLMDEPEQTKRELKRVYARLADELEFDHLLLAHGDPIVGAGRERLREFATG